MYIEELLPLTFQRSQQQTSRCKLLLQITILGRGAGGLPLVLRTETVFL